MFNSQTLFKGLERVEYNATDGFTGHAWTVDKDQEAATEAMGKNPWALRQHKREINRTLKGDFLRKEVDMLELCEEIGLGNHKNSISSEPYTKGMKSYFELRFNVCTTKPTFFNFNAIAVFNNIVEPLKSKYCAVKTYCKLSTFILTFFEKTKAQPILINKINTWLRLIFPQKAQIKSVLFNKFCIL